MGQRRRALEDLGVSPGFWKDKKVLITGHMGFKGSWLSLWLQSLGAEVAGYSLPSPVQPSLFETANVSEKMNSVTGDVRNLDKLKETLNHHSPQIIFHMAAQSLVLPSYEDPVYTYETNVMGTLNLLEAARYSEGLKVVVVVTSDKCYENKNTEWNYKEDDPMGGFDPYSSSKGCAELITSAYRNSFFSSESYESHGVSISSVRAGNVFGGGDWSDHRLIPDIIKAALDQRPAVIRNPNAIRPWQYVLEPINGYLTLAEKQWEQGAAYAEGWNFGPDEEDAKPVSWVVKKIADLWGEGFQVQPDEKQHPHEAHFLKLDCSKAHTRLQWQPKSDIAAGLEWTVQWYRDFHEGQPAQELCDNAILRFQDA